MEITTKSSKERQCKATGQALQLLDSPLPTPRRSCGSADTPSLHRHSADGSPLRTHVPFSWESSPGVPKKMHSSCADKEQKVLPPKPPPGRRITCHAREYHCNTSETSSDDDANDDTFSEALGRISSSDRLAALCARLSSFDGPGSRRSPSFIMDRFLPAANALATSSTGTQQRQSSRRNARRMHKEAAAGEAKHTKHPPSCSPAREHEEPASTPIENNDAIQVQVVQHINIEAQGGQMSPRACGLMVFFPWSIKPVLCGFRSPARCRPPPHADGVAPSPPHRCTTLGDVLEKEKKSNSHLPHLYDDKNGGGKEYWASPGWGMSFLDTSKKYCADARKALSRLAHGGTDGGSPRISKEMGRRKNAVSPLRTAAAKLPPLRPPSESWLAHARDTVNKKR